MLRRLRHQATEGLWIIPSVMVVGSLLLAVLTTFLDNRTEDRPFTDWIFVGDSDSARAILQTVASSVITFTALVFTITVVALQLASQQFSPRVLRTFLRDLQSKIALGMFIGTFLYSLMVLRVIDSTDDGGVTIPSISMAVLLVLVVASITMFVAYISHMTSSIRVSQIIHKVGEETRSLVDGLPHPHAQRKDRSRSKKQVTGCVEASCPGTLAFVDHKGLIDLARRSDAAFVLTRRVGDFLARGQLLLEIRGGEVDKEIAHGHLTLQTERDMRQDVNFGFRQLVDIAQKALSPSLNDPTTAVMAIDQIHDVLRRLASRAFPDAELVDDDGVVRLVIPGLDWDALVLMSLGQIRLFAGSYTQVMRRLRAALIDLEEVALEERKDSLRKELELLDALVDESLDHEADRQRARAPAPQRE